MHIDTGHSNVVPTITVQDIDAGQAKLNADAPVPPPQDPNDVNLPGAMPAGPAPAIPDWYKVGWRQASGIDAPPIPEGEEKDKAVLDLFLSDQFYGTWYHNAALIVVVSIPCHW